MGKLNYILCGVAWLVLVTSFVAGCDSSTLPTAAESTTPTATTTPKPLTNRGDIDSRLDLRFEVTPEVASGVPVLMKITLRNVSDDTIRVFLGGSPPTDFIVTRSDGTEVWNWRGQEENRVPLAIVGSPVQPGEILEWTEEWAQVDNSGVAVPPGEYPASGNVSVWLGRGSEEVILETDQQKITLLP
jgi:hypothetical protein